LNQEKTTLKAHQLEQIEIDLLLEAILRRYGYDFKNYARASIRRRIMKFMRANDLATISNLIPLLMHDKKFFGSMVKEFSITVTEMFRDPSVFLALRQEVVPVLKSFPFIRAWNAGCATGEEAYSLAILLKEEGMLKRATFFATDFNDTALETAREGVYDAEQFKKFTGSYQRAGGTGSLSDYYHARYKKALIDAELRKKITFANHNLVNDRVFTESHLIMCRNVLIYFNSELQDRVLRIFYESLVTGGFLCLGQKESLLFSSVQECFVEVDQKNKIYKKIR